MVFNVTVKGAAILFLGLLVIYVCKMFLDSGGWDKLIMAVFAFSAIFEIWSVAWELPVMRILPIAAIACGLVLSAAWAAFLGFEFFRAMELVL
jgi:hypothetical protein